MTYNILNGGENGIDKVISAICSESPDFLTINEASTFTANDNKVLKEIAVSGNFVDYRLALSGEHACHVAVFSKFAWKSIVEVKPLMRACVMAVFNSPTGEISIGGLHLIPYSEDRRLPEIELITQAQEGYAHKVLMGDFNSLSKPDNYSQEIVSGFNDRQLKKFTTSGELRFDAMEKVLSSGFIDPAVKLGLNGIYTAPTAINEYNAHTNMRLDYILVSTSLENKVSGYHVVKNELTETASDHYPVTLELDVTLSS